MKHISHITVIIWIFLFSTSHFNAYSQVVSGGTGNMSDLSLPIPKNSIGLTFKGNKASNSTLKIEVLEFKNNEQIQEVSSKNINQDLRLSSQSVFLLDIYRESNGVIRVRKTKPGEKYINIEDRSGNKRSFKMYPAWSSGKYIRQKYCNCIDI